MVRERRVAEVCQEAVFRLLLAVEQYVSFLLVSANRSLTIVHELSIRAEVACSLSLTLN